MPLQLLTFKLYGLYRPAQNYEVVYISAIWYDFEAKKGINVKLKPKNTWVSCLGTLDTKEARGFKKRQSSYAFPAIAVMDIKKKKWGRGGGAIPPFLLL